MRFDDSERKRAVRRVAKERRTPIVENTPDSGPESPQNVDIPAPREFFASLIRKAEDRRPLKRHRIARMYFVEGRTQQEIADLDGISQAAVSKLVRNFVEKDLPYPLDVRKILERGGYLRRGRPRKL